MINLKRAVMAVLAGTMLLVLPLTAGAASKFTVFPNITGLNVNGSKVIFVNMSGLAKSMSVTITTVDDSTGMKHIEKNRSLNGREEINNSFITPQDLVTPVDAAPLAESGHFVTLQDVIVFDDAELVLRGMLIAPTGNMATGPVQFQITFPGGSVLNGVQNFISGSAEVLVNVTNPTKNTGIMTIKNFQAGSYTKFTFTTTTGISPVTTNVRQAIPADIKVTVPTITKTFFLTTSIAR